MNQVVTMVRNAVLKNHGVKMSENKGVISVMLQMRVYFRYASLNTSFPSCSKMLDSTKIYLSYY